MQKAITDIVKQYLRDHGISQSKLAKELNVLPQSLGQTLKANSINSDLLMRISIILKYDFFKEMSAVLRLKMTDVSGANAMNADYEKTLTYESLLIENVLLHRRLDAANEHIDRLKSGSPATTIKPNKPQLKGR